MLWDIRVSPEARERLTEHSLGQNIAAGSVMLSAVIAHRLFEERAVH